MKIKFYRIISLTIVFLSFTLIAQASVFSSAREMSFPSSQFTVASADLNKDGIPDLVIGGDPIAGQYGKIRVGLGIGNGNFRNWREYVVGFNPNQISARCVVEIRFADFNNDSNLDVITSHNADRSPFNFSNVHASILLGDGEGNLQTGIGYNFVDVNPGAVQVMTLADLNNDGFTDVVLGLIFQSDRGKLFFMKNLGDGAFTTIGPKVIGGSVNGLGTAFVNKDQHRDVIVSTSEGSGVLFMDGNFFSTTGMVFDQNTYQREMVARDFNSDGKMDFAIAEFFNNRIRIFIQGAGGIPAVPVIYDTSLLPVKLKSYDFNRDGRDDLIYGALSGGIEVLYSNGDGTFSRGEQVATASMSDFAPADFDLNGKTDFVTASNMFNQSIQARVYLNAPNQSRYYTDFDGDRKSDFTVFRPSTRTFWTLPSGSSSFHATNFGFETDKLVVGNYDGDNKTDIGVYRNGAWYILQSSDGAFKADFWGSGGDIPVPADYDNDGQMNFAVYRPSEGVWYVKTNNGYSATRWGINIDKPVPADYDGDGKADLAVWRPTEGVWYILRSSDNNFLIQQFGIAEDKPVPADYDGDGKTDIAVFRPDDSYWYILQSLTRTIRYERFGLADDIPVPNDFDGDGKNDVAVFRPNDGYWYILQSTNNSFNAVKWGTNGDIPLKAIN